jgi:hypothetical protein
LLSMKKTGAAVFATAILGVGLAGPAAAANNSRQSGLVNVSLGDVSILDNANIGVAANVAAAVCGINVGPVAVLAVNTAATGTQHTVCTLPSGQTVTLNQSQ